MGISPVVIRQVQSQDSRAYTRMLSASRRLPRYRPPSLQEALMCRPLLLLISVTAAAPVTAAPQPERGVLRVALEACILAKTVANRSFPCLAVDLGEKDRAGTAILRAPGQPTHTVIIPTTAVSGLEAPVLQGPSGVAYWRAALDARRYVSDELKGRLSAEDIGLAVNSVGGRSQDQLHIHLDCVKPSVQAALQQYRSSIGNSWAAMPISLQGSRFFAMRLAADQVEAFNPFAALSHLPGRQTGLENVSLAMVSVPGEAGRRDSIFLAYRSPGAHAEKLLEHTCTPAKKAAAN